MAVEFSDDIEAFIAAFSENWHASGQGRMEGRLLAYLLVVSADKVSSAELAEAMGAGTGAISMATRALVEQGFIRRLRVPGDRSHYFAAADDVWGGFLSAERRWVHRMQSVLDNARQQMPLAPGADRRVHVAAEYMNWLGGYNLKMLRDWHEHLASHVAPQEDPS
ncbi:DNA-binding transcriptional regulator GbsR (MarR family) [Nakamurella sp. UYEF19]|uniref:GbsR/MarR family transcriptional regulator n=1 Tax=Nakamurella sp. UYEF19 TaxID=1756392 RepID=UPI003393F069